jgi:hypothetical protein
MAVYMSAGHRRRRTVIIVIAAVVLGLVVGFVLGRATSSGVDDAVADAKDKGASAVTALSRLPIEYEQKVGGTGGETARTLLDSVDAAEARLEDAFDAAPWLRPTQQRAARAAIASVRADVEDDVSPEEFQAGIDDASKVIASTFGIPVSSDLN